MLQVGDRIVYPMHGAGEITCIEECEIMGQVREYYVLQLPLGNIKIMLPTDNVDNIGLRQISPPEMVSQVETTLPGKPEPNLGSWNKRFHRNMDRLKGGDLLEAAAVIRNLILQDRKRKISSGERRLLDLAKQIFFSELSFILEKDIPETEAWSMERLDKNEH